MKLSRTVSYAVRATLQLAQARSAHPVPCSRLAAEGKMPERFLLQVLRNLVTHGILRSTRGVEGGYSMQRAPDEVSLLDVIEAVEGKLESPPPVGEGISELTQERLHAALRRVTNQARQELEQVTIAKLLEDTAHSDRTAVPSAPPDN